jgi:hypothetical protein
MAHRYMFSQETSFKHLNVDISNNIPFVLVDLGYFLPLLILCSLRQSTWRIAPPIRKLDLQRLQVYAVEHAHVETCHAREEVGIWIFEVSVDFLVREKEGSWHRCCEPNSWIRTCGRSNVQLWAWDRRCKTRNGSLLVDKTTMGYVLQPS